MDFAGASRTLHARDRPLRGALVAGLLAVLALALAAGPANAQVQAPPDTAPGLTAPAQPVDDHGWPDDRDGGYPHGDGDMPGEGGGVRPHAPGAGMPPPRAGDAGEDDGRRPGDEDEQEELPPVRSRYVAGNVARMRTDGKAAIPRGAPKRVRSLIAQYNRIVGKRYKWGGGHAKLVDAGYDCSGAVGYGLIKGGLLRTTMVQRQLRALGRRRHRALGDDLRAPRPRLRRGGRAASGHERHRRSRGAQRRALAPGHRAPRGFKARHPTGL